MLKKSELPNPYIVITLGLPYSLESPRVAVKSKSYAGRRTTHIVIGTVDGIDEKLMTKIDSDLIAKIARWCRETGNHV